MRARWLPLVAVLVAVAHDARADDVPFVSLAYEAAGDDSCPDERHFRDLLTSRMGYDPVRSSARGSVDVRIEKPRSPRGHATLAATVTFRAQPDAKPARRDLVGDEGRCLELAQAVAVTLAILVDPFGEHRAAAAEATPAPAVAATAPPVSASARDGRDARDEAPEAPPPEPDRSPAPPSHLDVVVTGGPTLGLVPDVALGGAAGGAWRRGALAIGASARFETTLGDVPVGAGRVHASLVGATLAVCGARSVLRGCVASTLGSYAARDETVVTPTTRTTFFADVALRIGVRVPVASRVALEAFVEGRGLVTRPELIVDGARVWRSSPVAATLAAGPSFEVF